MATLVVSDSSPLIGLAAAGVFEALRDLFENITVTRIVRNEIMAGEGMAGTAELSAAMREGWIRVAPAPLETWRFAELGAGEASTIAHALKLRADRAPPDAVLVLMDDALGRAQAAALGLEVVDLAGLLLRMKRAGLIDAVRPLLERLARRGFIVPESSIQNVLAAAGEGLTR